MGSVNVEKESKGRKTVDQLKQKQQNIEKIYTISSDVRSCILGHDTGSTRSIYHLLYFIDSYFHWMYDMLYCSFIVFSM